MNALQKNYIEAKAQYEEVFEKGQWDKLDNVSDTYIEAEEKLVAWAYTMVDHADKIFRRELAKLKATQDEAKWNERVVQEALKLRFD